MKRVSVTSIAIAVSLFVQSVGWTQGTWTQITKPIPIVGSGLSMLLSDGSVIVNGGGPNTGVTASWAKLTPDSSGNYVKGTWSLTAPMNLGRLYFASNVLPSGKVFVCGGEYSGPFGNQNFTNAGEIYDPVANTWTTIATFPQPAFGDDPSVVLPSGQILCGYISGPQTYLYNPLTNSWSQTGTKLNKDRSDEETWALLPDGSVLSYDIFNSPATGAGTAQRYIPSTGTWKATGPVPVPLTNSINDGLTGGLGDELGPMMLLPDGRVLLIGANNNTVLYTPSSDTWAQGPSLPTNYGCDDAPAAILPNGHVLILADNSLPIDFTPPTKAFDFDPVANTLTDVTPTGTLGAIFASNVAQQFCLLVLPNGHVLLTTDTGGVWDYAPTGTPSAAWAPTITTVTKGSNNTYTLTGTQLNGISEGSSFGDDRENSTNYPIVRLKSGTGVVTYARTSNWAPGVVASGSRTLSVQFAPPSSLPNGIYQLNVIANGISYSTVNFTLDNFSASNVTAQFTAGTLTITGDSNSNSLTVSLQAGVIKVEGANGTKINGNSLYSSVVSGPIAIVANLGDGDDAISFIGVNSSTSNINLGNGNDQAAFTLCNIGTLTIDGGAGTDTFLKTSSKITTLHESNIP